MSIADKLKTVAQKMEDVYRTGLFKYAPKSTASGEMVLLENSVPEPFVDMVVHGKSWQNTTEGHQLGDFTRFPNTSIGGATLTNNGDGSLTISGNGTLTSSFNAQVDYTHEETISLIRSGRLYALIETLVVPYLYLYLFYDNGNKKAELYCLSGTHEHTDITEEMLDDSCCLRIGFYGSTGDEIKSGTIKPMLYQDGDGTWEQFTHGSTPNPYYPQPIESAKEVKVLGGNYFNINNFDESIQDNGVYRKDNGFAMQNYYNGVYTRLGVLCPELKDGDEVYLNLEVENRGSTVDLYLFGSGRDWIPGNSLVITQADLDDAFSVYGIDGETTIYKNIIISKEPIPFEPYKEPQTLSLPSLYGIGDGRDYVDFERKKLVRRCVELTFDGNEDWIIYDSDEYYGFYLTCLPEKMDRREGLCNQLIVDYAIGEGSKDAFWLGVANSTELYVIRNSFFDSALSDKGLSNWKAHLNENPLKIVTYIAEPIETDLTDEEVAMFKALHTNYPTTTIISDTEVEVTYVADTKNYIDNLIKG